MRNGGGLHTTSGRWQLGLALSLGAVAIWGLLPIALSGLLKQMDPVTITWYRFVVAGLVLLIPVARARGLAALAPGVAGARRTLALLSVASVALVANYILYVLSLRFLTSSGAQVLIQLAPTFLLVGGLIVFRERLSRVQLLGIGVLAVGFAMFFHNDLPGLVSGSGDGRFLAGALLIVAAAITWAAYALAQKQLLSVMSSPSIMVVIYVVSSVLLLPLARPAAALTLDSLGVGLLVFLAFNTLAAYGCFAEALEHLEASRVSIVLSLTPIVTIAAVTIGARVVPMLVDSESLDATSLLGAGLVVAGSMLGALGRRPLAVHTGSPAARK